MTATKATKTMTTAVDASACFGVGQVTFFSSALASERNRTALLNSNLTFSIMIYRALLGKKLAGQEGLEPPASGFGVRRSIH